jgi:CheY-like chemotaxis protein
MNQTRKKKNPPIRPQKVLVVDDDAVIRDMMADILSGEGYTPELARNGKEALRILQSQTTSYLVFLDLMMPNFGGRDVCAALAAQPEVRARHVIVLMSAMDKLEDTSSLDVDMVMPKPFVVDDVSEVLEACMG